MAFVKLRRRILRIAAQLPRSSWRGLVGRLQAKQSATRGADRKRNAAAAGGLVSGTGIGKPEIQFAKTPRKSLKSRKART
jgi:hypothetical protein